MTLAECTYFIPSKIWYAMNLTCASDMYCRERIIFDRSVSMNSKIRYRSPVTTGKGGKLLH